MKKLRVRENLGEIRVQAANRIPRSPPALELRMMAIAAGLALQHCLGKQGLAPERYEPPGVEILGVERPEAQGTTSIAARVSCGAR
jgi:hypothetical protein